MEGDQSQPKKDNRGKRPARSPSSGDSDWDTTSSKSDPVSDRIPIPEIDDADLREHILRLRGLVAEETIETLKMVRLDHIVNPRGKLLEYDQAAFRAWVIAWLNALETVVCAHMAMLTKKLFGGQAGHTIQELVAQPDRLLEQVEDIKRALEIILTVGPEMTPEKADTGKVTAPRAESTPSVKPTPSDEYPMPK